MAVCRGWGRSGRSSCDVSSEAPIARDLTGMQVPGFRGSPQSSGKLLGASTGSARKIEGVRAGARLRIRAKRAGGPQPARLSPSFGSACRAAPRPTRASRPARCRMLGAGPAGGCFPQRRVRARETRADCHEGSVESRTAGAVGRAPERLPLGLGTGGGRSLPRSEGSGDASAARDQAQREGGQEAKRLGATRSVGGRSEERVRAWRHRAGGSSLSTAAGEQDDGAAERRGS